MSKKNLLITDDDVMTFEQEDSEEYVLKKYTENMSKVIEFARQYNIISYQDFINVKVNMALMEKMIIEGQLQFKNKP